MTSVLVGPGLPLFPEIAEDVLEDLFIHGCEVTGLAVAQGRNDLSRHFFKQRDEFLSIIPGGWDSHEDLELLLGESSGNEEPELLSFLMNRNSDEKGEGSAVCDAGRQHIHLHRILLKEGSKKQSIPLR